MFIVTPIKKRQHRKIYKCVVTWECMTAEIYTINNVKNESLSLEEYEILLENLNKIYRNRIPFSNSYAYDFSGVSLIPRKIEGGPILGKPCYSKGLSNKFLLLGHDQKEIAEVKSKLEKDLKIKLELSEYSKNDIKK